jgi:two-component system cell cycle response regulator DivK
MRSVLIVDDNRASRELMRDVLEPCHVTVSEAANGRDAVDIATAVLPNLVLLDLEMPVCDGFSVLAQLRSRPETQSIPVLAITANAMEAARERALGAGFDGYLTKPINIVSLRCEVERFLHVQRQNTPIDARRD